MSLSFGPRKTKPTAKPAPAPAPSRKWPRVDSDDLYAGHFGLVYNGSHKLPISRCKVNASVKQSVARVTVTQTFKNDSRDVVDATYFWPLSDRAAVTGFTATVNKRTIKGIVKSKLAARKTYNEAKRQGKTAALMESNEKKPDVFTIAVGNIIPSATCIIEVEFVVELELSTSAVPDYGAVLFSLPKKMLVPGFAHREFEGVSVHLDCVMTSDVQSVSLLQYESKDESSAERPHTEINKKTATFDVCFLDNSLKHDVSIAIAVASIDKPLVFVEHNKELKSHAVMLSWMPVVSQKNVQSEMIFLVDRSGSMAGTRVMYAALAMINLLALLPSPTVLFNIVSFGSRSKQLFLQSKPATTANLLCAMLYCARFKADFGGTVIRAPLETIFAQPVKPGYARQVFVLTDGVVKDTDAVVKLVRKHANNTRVFSFGIGNDASRKLVRGMARSGGGRHCFIERGDGQMIASVSEQVQRSLTSAVTSLSCSWRGMHATRAPYNLRPIFDGEAYTIYGIVHGIHANFKPVLHVQGYLPDGQRLDLEVPVDLEHAVEGHDVHAVAAREMIRDLEEETSKWHQPYPLCYRDTLCEIMASDCASIVLAFLMTPAQAVFQSGVPGFETFDGIRIPRQINILPDRRKRANPEYIRPIRTGRTGRRHVQVPDRMDDSIDLSPAWREAQRSAVEHNIIELGLKYQLASSQTSFVAVDDAQDAVNEEQDRQKRPEQQHLRETEEEAKGPPDNLAASSSSSSTSRLRSASSKKFSMRSAEMLFGNALGDENDADDLVYEEAVQQPQRRSKMSSKRRDSNGRGCIQDGPVAPSSSLSISDSDSSSSSATDTDTDTDDEIRAPEPQQRDTDLFFSLKKGANFQPDQATELLEVQLGELPAGFVLTAKQGQAETLQSFQIAISFQPRRAQEAKKTNTQEREENKEPVPHQLLEFEFTMPPQFPEQPYSIRCVTPDNPFQSNKPLDAASFFMFARSRVNRSNKTIWQPMYASLPIMLFALRLQLETNGDDSFITLIKNKLEENPRNRGGRR